MPSGDSAQGIADLGTNGISFKRVSDVFTKDKLTMFAKGQTFSTLNQGGLGDCYYLAALVAIDNREGALENMFVTKEINSKGIYAMKLQVNGEMVVVHVDDYIPVRKTYRFGRSGYFPPYANSKVEGEIWPMIAEKIWAKVNGSYSNIESAAPSWAFSHLTNDPTTQISKQWV